MNHRTFALIALFFIGALSACNYTHVRGASGAEASRYSGLSTNEIAEKMNYAYVANSILKPKCVGCHGNAGGVSLESYADVQAHQHEIHQSVFVEHSMPKRGALTADEMRILWNWLDMGCPQESAASLPTGGPAADLKPTFASIDSQIIQPKCVSCHSPGQDAAKILLDKASLFNSKLHLVTPGDPNHSRIVIAVERTDSKRMPLSSEGAGPLSPAEKRVIRLWVKNGAAD